MSPSLAEKVTEFNILLEERKILSRIGYKKIQGKSDHSLQELIIQEKKRAKYLIQPVSIHTILDYEETNKHPVFKNAEKVALCLCTIGPDLERVSRELFAKNEFLRGLILDALGSEAVGEVTRQSEKILVEKARRMGLWPSKRYAPGYKGWEVKEQKFVFEKLPAEEIGVRLSVSFMMIPRKSYSFRLNFYSHKELTTRNFR
jgi:hypothetical protein